MSKKKGPSKPRSKAVEWTPFESVVPEFNSNLKPEQIESYLQGYRDGRVFMYQNSLYTIHLRLLGATLENALWLSIRRNDRQAVHDWRHFQRIKNELVGPEREAVEIFPKESQLVDTANSYHLWVLDEVDSLPFGFKDGRTVATPDEAAEVGAGQRLDEVADKSAKEHGLPWL